ncbi:sulfotransferase 1 family member D1-like isoform X2 [Patiria miniata]|uniref:Sulfotransferase domain-containing protein n=1 Tax=Patiria miniata TaxID=46514 RepID=A0A913ZVB5_PATMI|nr:sulfotransferase 1 family member D1-like isoform X2 [Patiria miniata]
MDKYITVEQLFEAKKKYVPTAADHAVWEYRGIHLPSNVYESAMQELHGWAARTADIFIVTYPKAGTTWASEIVSCLINDGNMDVVNSRHITSRVPFLELIVHGTPEFVPPNYKILEDVASPRIVKSHLPGQLLPPDVWKKKAKVVYVLRNPKDLAVSLFYFGKAWQEMGFSNFLERFKSGEVDYGPWWEHYLYFWTRRHEDNVCIMKYEDMQRDLKGVVTTIGKFLGKELSNQTIDAIVEHCSFNSMKSNPMANMDTVRPNQPHQFMRKVTEATGPNCLYGPPPHIPGSDVEACGDTDNRRMAQEFDSRFPLYLIVSEDDIYRDMTLTKSQSLLFTQWATHLQPEQEHQSKVGQHTPSPSHRQKAPVQRPGRTRAASPSHGLHGDETSRIGVNVGLPLPTSPPPPNNQVNTPTIPFPGHVNFIVTVGSTPSTSQRNRRAKRRKEKTYLQ